MDYVYLGNSGLAVSRISLGAFGFGDPAWQRWVLDEAASRPIIRRALELGINVFDTADYYSLGASETVLGRVLREHARRDEVIVVTKAFHPTGPSVNESGLSRRHLFQAIDLSLRRLGMDWVDVYQIHRLDQFVPMEETLEALHDIVKSGKARYIGASNMVAWQFAKALYIQKCNGWTRFIVMQNHYNLIYREEEREMLPLCRAEGIGYTPFSPLARGFLVGKGADVGSGASPRTSADQFIGAFYNHPSDYVIRTRLHEIAARRGVGPARVALAWMLGRPGVTGPVVGATKTAHVEDAVSALDLALEDSERDYLAAPYEPHPVLLHTALREGVRRLQT
ncbi:MAG: aldo/keto reductase [Alphaproteobacteria bacterium]